MFSNRTSIASVLESFHVDDRMLAYNNFVARLYNWCLSMGFMPGKIMPARAFCSDESQGFPIILLAKHFGAFPFNHGRLGGIISLDRHGPHADHGRDLVLIQASHVGYDPDSAEFGVYRRLHTQDESNSCNCGKIGNIIEWYRTGYQYARENVRLLRHGDTPALLIDNQLLSRNRTEGIFLVADRLIEGVVRHNHLPPPLAARSTGMVYAAANSLVERLGAATWPTQGSVQIGPRLVADDFFFVREFVNPDISKDQLESNILPAMPWILTCKHPLLAAARANTIAEFDRAYRSLTQSPKVRGKNMLFLAGLNIDISPYPGENFPLTKFMPWAAYLQREDGSRELLEQDELIERLAAQPADNPSQLALDKAIATMVRHRDVRVRL
ncbi:MAG: hypothetical protein FJ209_01820 [Betaproteobacteria bacterium]|nr:hypothetical protein [Betaproteobacteria bacterium]